MKLTAGPFFALAAASLALLAGCPDNAAKPGAAPAASGSTAPATTASGAATATGAASAGSSGSGW